MSKYRMIGPQKRISLRNEVRHHLKKGRSTADIVAWLEYPYSVIDQLIKEVKVEDAKLDPR